MKSKLKAHCQKCSHDIEIGDEIVRIGNGLWTHEKCASTQEKVENSENNDFTQKLIESKMSRNKSFQCVNCNSSSFLKPKIETSVLDDGGTLTKKLYICYNCSYIMQFVDKIN